jgi:hypothetical protein
MTDAAIFDLRRKGGRYVLKSGSARDNAVADLAERSALRSGEKVGPASASVAGGRSARRGLGRWLLEGLVVSFAYGGCIHNMHPDYVDFLRDLSRSSEPQI